MSQVLSSSALTLQTGTALVHTTPAHTQHLLSHTPHESCTQKKLCDGCLTPFARHLDALHHRLAHPPAIPTAPHATITVPTGTTRSTAQLATYQATLHAAMQPNHHGHSNSTLPSYSSERSENEAAASFHDPFNHPTYDLTTVLARVQRAERPNGFVRQMRMEKYGNRYESEEKQREDEERQQRTEEGAKVLEAFLALHASRDALAERTREARAQSEVRIVPPVATAPASDSPFYSAKYLHRAGHTWAPAAIQPVAPLLDPLHEAIEASKNFGRPRTPHSMDAARVEALEQVVDQNRAAGRTLTPERQEREIARVLDPFATGSIIPEVLRERERAKLELEEEKAERAEAEARALVRQTEKARVKAARTMLHEAKESTSITSPFLSPHPVRGFVIRLKDHTLPNNLLVVAQPKPRPMEQPNPHVHPGKEYLAQQNARGKWSKNRTRVWNPVAAEPIRRTKDFDRDQAERNMATIESLAASHVPVVEANGQGQVVLERVGEGQAQASWHPSGAQTARAHTADHPSNTSHQDGSHSHRERFFHSPAARTLQAALTGGAPSTPFSDPASSPSGRVVVDDLLGNYSRSAIGQHNVLTSRTRHWATQYQLKVKKVEQQLHKQYAQATPPNTQHAANHGPRAIKDQLVRKEMYEVNLDQQQHALNQQQHSAHVTELSLGSAPATSQTDRSISPARTGSLVTGLVAPLVIPTGGPQAQGHHRSTSRGDGGGHSRSASREQQGSHSRSPSRPRTSPSPPLEGSSSATTTAPVIPALSMRPRSSSRRQHERTVSHSPDPAEVISLAPSSMQAPMHAPSESPAHARLNSMHQLHQEELARMHAQAVVLEKKSSRLKAQEKAEQDQLAKEKAHRDEIDAGLAAAARRAQEQQQQQQPHAAIFHAAAHVDSSGRVTDPTRAVSPAKQALLAQMRSFLGSGGKAVSPRHSSGVPTERDVERAVDVSGLKIDGSHASIAHGYIALKNNAAPHSSRVRTSRMPQARGSQTARPSEAPLMTVRPLATPAAVKELEPTISMHNSMVTAMLPGVDPRQSKVHAQHPRRPSQLDEPSSSGASGGYEVSSASFMSSGSFPTRAPLGRRVSVAPVEPARGETGASATSMFLVSRFKARLTGGKVGMALGRASIARRSSEKPLNIREPEANESGEKKQTFRRSWYDLKLQSPGPTRKQLIADRQKQLQWEIHRRLYSEQQETPVDVETSAFTFGEDGHTAAEPESRVPLFQSSELRVQAHTPAYANVNSEAIKSQKSRARRVPSVLRKRSSMPRDVAVTPVQPSITEAAEPTSPLEPIRPTTMSYEQALAAMNEQQTNEPSVTVTDETEGLTSD